MKSTRSWRRIAQIVSGVVLLSIVVVSPLSLVNLQDSQPASPVANAPVAGASVAGPGLSGRPGYQGPIDKSGPAGPIVITGDAPTVFTGSLLDLVGRGDNPVVMDKFGRENEITPNQAGLVPNPGFIDAVAQTVPGQGQMPDPIMSFDGLNRNDGSGWSPPDTVGDVGPNHYIQGVNIALGVYDKVTGAELVNLPFNAFFNLAPAPCNTQNRGDIIIQYDEMADRWIVNDFSLPSSGPVYQCIAVSMSGDPVSGGWYFYAFMVDSDGAPWHDYPKFGVWPDAYYMTANMFDPWSGAYIWALDRAAMLAGLPINAQEFHTGAAYASLLPANVRGTVPPAGAPNYLTSFSFPNTLNLWKLFIDWNNPNNSHLDGPTELTVANASMIGSIPQGGTSQQVDSLGDRLMYLLQYRNFGDHESLWVSHTVAHADSAGMRWYEVRDPGGTPVVYQQGTYAPDNKYRWMGSVAVDQDGNMALGYSVSSSSMFPAIRYAGRLRDEALGELPQAEASLIEGTGSQTGGNRWGDYSAMTIDPADDCTFWYTTMYFKVNGGTWETRIGSFKFPSCGKPKGTLTGQVYNAETMAPIPGIPVVIAGITTTLTAETDANGNYTADLVGDIYAVTAGPLEPSYPNPVTIPGVAVVNLQTTILNIPVAGVPNLVPAGTVVDDNVPGGNYNGYPEPGETGLLLWQTLQNDGGATATNLTAALTALTPGVTVDVAEASYPDLPIGGSALNQTAFVISLDPTIPCGELLEFELQVTSDQGGFTVPFTMYAGVLLPPDAAFEDDMENGTNGWVPGGSPNTWGQTTSQSHSPTHSWTDSPSGNYGNNVYNYVRSPILNLSGKKLISLDFWHRYDLENGWDYGYVEYSPNGGTNWYVLNPEGWTGQQLTWMEEVMDLSVLDGLPAVAFRFRMSSDGGVVADGWYIDDVQVLYQPFACNPVGEPPATPELLAPPDGTITTTQELTLGWQAGAGVPPDGYVLSIDGVTTTITGTTYTDVFTFGAHTWQVQAYNLGGFSGWSPEWDFTVVELPGAPVLLAPENGTITTTQDLTFAWEAGLGGVPESYELELDGATYTTTATSWNTTLGFGLHTWQVRALNAGGYSDWSEAWTVEVVELPGTPVLLAPVSGTLTTTQTIDFAWQAGSGGAPDFYNLEINGEVFTSTQPSMSMTLDLGAYTWRVQAVNAGGLSEWTEAWTFEIVPPLAPPATPLLASPISGTVTAAPAITFAWTPGEGDPADGYELEVDGMVYTTTQTSQVLTLPVGAHTWRVRAFNAAGASEFSETWTITVRAQVFLPITLRAPLP